WLLEGLRPGRRWALATTLAGGGVAVLVLASASDASVSAAGIVLALLASLGYVAYALLTRRLLRRGHTPGGVMAGAFGCGAVLLVPVLLLAGGGALASPSGAALALYLGVVPTAG